MLAYSTGSSFFPTNTHSHIRVPTPPPTPPPSAPKRSVTHTPPSQHLDIVKLARGVRRIYHIFFCLNADVFVAAAHNLWTTVSVSMCVCVWRRQRRLSALAKNTEHRARSLAQAQAHRVLAVQQCALALPRMPKLMWCWRARASSQSEFIECACSIDSCGDVFRDTVDAEKPISDRRRIRGAIN